MDGVHFQHHIVVHKIGQRVLIGHNAANLRRRQEHILRLLRGKEGLHLILPGQIQFLMGAGDDVGIALALQLPDYGGTYHAPVSRHIDLCVFLHHLAASIIAFSRFAKARSCSAMIRTSCA